MKYNKWTKEKVIEIAQKYEYFNDLRKDYGGLYKISKDNGWLKEFTWLKYKLHQWNKENVFNESKKYEYISDFRKHSYCAYESARKNGWLKELTWLKEKDMKYPYSIYVYVDDDNKVAYVGLTRDKITRHNTHKTGVYKNHICQTSVFKYFTNICKNVPEPIYLEENLSVNDAKIKENEWCKTYENMGYHLLNVAKTGEFSSSIGGKSNKWTKDAVIEESKKYDNKNDFRKNSSTAYACALKYKLLDEMTWLKPKLKHWNKDMVINESKKYNSRREFYLSNGTAYDISLKNGWLDEMTWLKPKHIIWTDDMVIDESKQYKTRNEFRLKCPCGYAYARRNNLFNQMSWLEESKTGKKWNKENVLEIAKQYDSIKEFRDNYSYLYEIARKNKWLKDIDWNKK